MKKMARHIRKHGRFFGNHVKKHHKTYIVGGFGLYGLIKTVILLFSFFASYSLSFATNSGYSWLEDFDENTNINQIIQSFFGDVDEETYSSFDSLEDRWTDYGNTESNSQEGEYQNQEGLIFSLDGSNSGNLFKDISSNNYRVVGYGDIQNLNLIDDGYIVFDGKDDYLEIDDDIIDGYPFAMSAWVNFSDTGSYTILSLANSEDKNTYYAISLGANNEEGSKFRILGKSDGTTRSSYGNLRYFEDTWNHVVGVFESEDSRKIYVNGNLLREDDKYLRFDSNVDRWNVGRLGDETASQYFSGKMYDINLYDIGFSDQDVKDLYLEGINQFELISVGDTMLNSDNKKRGYNYGAVDYLDIYNKNSIGLLRFDLPDFDDNIEILGGRIVLTKLGGDGTRFYVREVINNDWNEGLGNGREAVIGESTYEVLGFPDLNWYAGYNYFKKKEDSGVSNLTETIDFDQESETKIFELSEDGLQLLKDWYDGSNNNDGFSLYWFNGSFQIATKEHEIYDYRPKLIIDYIYSTGNNNSATGSNNNTGKFVNISDDLVMALDDIDMENDDEVVQDNVFVKNVVMNKKWNKVKVRLKERMKVYMEDGSYYKGKIKQPEDIAVEEIGTIGDDVEIKYAFDVGSESNIYFENENGEEETVLFHVDLEDEDYYSGEVVLLYYSHDNQDRSVWGEEIVNYDEEFGLYLEFDINHMTSFAVGKKNKEETLYEEVLEDLDTKKDKNIIKDSKVSKDIELVSNDREIKAKISKDTYLKDKDGGLFEGQIVVPKKIDTDSLLGFGLNIYYAFEVGSTGTIKFEYENGSSSDIDILVDITEDIFSGKNIGSGDYIDVYYAEDLEYGFDYLDKVLVKSNGSGLYVEFQVDHMTIFSFADASYDFYICNNKGEELLETTSSSVYLCTSYEEGERNDPWFVQYANDPSSFDYEKGWNKTFSTEPQPWTLSDYGNVSVWSVYASKDLKTVSEEISDTVLRPLISNDTVQAFASSISAGYSGSLQDKYLIANSSSDNSSFKLNAVGLSSAEVFVWGEDWDGEFDAPSILNSSSSKNILPQNNNQISVATYIVGADEGTDLYLNGVEAEVIFDVDGMVDDISGLEDGRKLKVYSSSDGANWTFDGYCDFDSSSNICTKDDVDHFSYFGLVYEWHDNDDFIDQAFWDLNPTDAEIIEALYGTSTDLDTAYTHNWTGYEYSTCLDNPLTISHVSTPPTTMSSNTIYVLASGSYDISSTIYPNDCSALISSGEVILNKAATIHMVYNSSRNNIIFDNINFNQSGITNYGIYFNNLNNSTLNNIEVYAGINYGIYLLNVNHDTLNNVQSHDNTYGLYIYNSTNKTSYNNVIKNSQFYNNTSMGIYFRAYSNGAYLSEATNNVFDNLQIYNNASYGIAMYNYSYGGSYGGVYNNTINNSQIYNNGSYGIYVTNNTNTTASTGIHKNVINNSQIYNNGSYGIRLIESAVGYTDTNLVINNTKIYYNNTYGIYNGSSDNVIFLGNIKMFGNGINTYGNMMSGNPLAYADVGWSAANLDTSSETMSYDWMTKAMDENLDYGPYANYTSKGRTTSWTGATKYYSYGDNILKQINPVVYEDGNLVLSDLEWDANKYIAQHNGWSNEFFVDDSFWESDPSDEEIVWAYYGDGNGLVDDTAYTEYWTTDGCNTGSMNIVEVNSVGNWNLGFAIAQANTIYTLSPGKHIRINGVTPPPLYITWTAQTMLSNCSAIVGKGDSYLYTNSNLGTTWPGSAMISADGRSNTIIDNIVLDGEGNGLGGSHTANDYGILFYGGSLNNSVVNSSVRNLSNAGIYIVGGQYTYMDSLDVYNIDDDGIYIKGKGGYDATASGPGADGEDSNYNMLNNSNIYNVVDKGVYVNYGGGGNCYDIYDGGDGGDAMYNVFNNLNLYNNDEGMYFYDTTPGFSFNCPGGGSAGGKGNVANSVVNNSHINNNNIGITAAIYSDTFVNDIKAYNNTTALVPTDLTYYGTLQLFDNNTNYSSTPTAGSAISSLGWSAGTISTVGCMTCDWYVNPQNGLGVYMMDTGTYETCTGRGNISWSNTGASDYLFGSLISEQQENIEYPGSSTLSLSDVNYFQNNLVGEYENSLGNYTGNYACNGCDRDDTTWWDNDEFLTQTGFWDQNPTYCDIIAAIWGTGSSDTTAYTETRSGYAGDCDIDNMVVEYKNPGTNQIPQNLSPNTVYILNSGNYIYDDDFTYAIGTNDCNAIVGIGDVFLYTLNSKDQMIRSISVEYNIIDNVSIDGISNGFSSTHNKNRWAVKLGGNDYGRTINNSQIYGHDDYAIDTYNSDYGFVNNTQFYNNDRVFFFDEGDYWNINNSQFYNNGRVFQMIYEIDYLSINNSQFYNNEDISFNIANSLISNSQFYNNDVLGSTRINNSIFHDIGFYNNNTGFWFNSSANNKYYGELLFFDNGINFVGTDANDSVLSPGLSSDYSGLLDNGYLSNNGCMSCAWITNPLNGDGDYLIDTGSYSNCDMTGTNSSRDAEEKIEYKYGTMIKKQSIPFLYNGSFYTGYLGVDTGLYIAEVNNIGEYSGAFCDCTTQTYSWDNSSFITGAFWDTNPTLCDIVAAVYGTGAGDETAYNSNWSGWNNHCNFTNMDLQHISAGNGNIPNNLTANTVYVLASGDHLLPYVQDGINMSGCNVIIGNGDVRIYSTGSISAVGMINNYGYEFDVIDNVSIDSDFGHADNNRYGIQLNGANNNTINNIESYNNSHYGVFIEDSSNYNLVNNSILHNNVFNGCRVNSGSSYNIINDIWAYNNQNGIILKTDANYNTINNVQAYNNSEAGVAALSNSSGNSINNIQAYNNYYGAGTSGASNNYFNNIITYNNEFAGFGLLYDSDNNIINNILSYNNGYGIFTVGSAAGNVRYGTLKLFDNVTADFGVTTNGSDGVLTGGSSSDSIISGLWRSTGEIDTFGCMTCDWATNPQNSLGDFLVNTGSYPECERRGYTGVWNNTGEINYLYGSLISKQETGVYYTGGSLEFSDLYYDPTKFIAEINSLGVYTGNYSCNYCDINDVWWNNDNFITQTGFWDNNPDACDIMRAVYGTGAGDTTAYTENWSGWDYSCDWDSGLGVEYISAGNGNIPNNLTANTVYVLASGDHLLPYVQDGINMSGCNSIIGNGDVTVYSTGNIFAVGMINNYGYEFNVIDNIDINGEDDGLGSDHSTNKYGINLNGLYSNTVNKVNIFNNDYGLYLYGVSNGFFNWIQVHDNITEGLSLRGQDGEDGVLGSDGDDGLDSNNNIINNILSYNNGVGVRFWYGYGGSCATNYDGGDGGSVFNNVINNSQIYNNSDGFNSWGNTSQHTLCLGAVAGENGFIIDNSINNLHTYNNYRGLHLGYGNYFVNNIFAYNNNYGFKIDTHSTGNIFYGELRMFDNDLDFDGTTGADQYLTGGTNSSLGRDDGEISDVGCMTCDWYSNPKNIVGDYMMNTGIYPTCTGRGNISWTTTGGFSYLYGSLISKQETGVYYTGGSLEFSDLYYDPTKFIAEINSLGVYTGNYSCNYCDINDVWWNNDNFITQTGFWDNNPSVCDIMRAIYGTGAGDTTAYTENWSGWDYSCGWDSGLDVDYISAGNGNIPNNLTANTVYVLASGDHLLPYVQDGINMSGCNVIIGNGDVTVYSTGPISAVGMINNYGYEFDVIDNVNIDGYNDGSGSSHNKNQHGISVNSPNFAINSVSVFNHNSRGIYMKSAADYAYLHNIYAYNNDKGVEIGGAYTILDNAKTFNNGGGTTSHGVDIEGGANYVSLNNIQSYNNQANGINSKAAADPLLNNIYSYNNGDNGINLRDSISELVLNNVYSYNNVGWGLTTNFTDTGTYYGTIKMFDNGDGNVDSANPVTQGLVTDPGISGLGWFDGDFDTWGCMTCDWYSNSKNTFGEFLMDTGTYFRCREQGPFTWTGTKDNEYLYGSLIGQQTTGAYYDLSTTIVNAIYIYDSGNFIAEINSLGTYTGNYACNVCDPTDVYSWDNANFMDQTFWNTDPTDCEIIAAIYGTGVGDETAYTENWSGWDNSCLMTNMVVYHTDPGNGTTPNILEDYAIYLLYSGDHLVPYSTGINMSSCSAVVGSGEAKIYSTGGVSSAMIENIGYVFGVVDGVEIDGERDGISTTHGTNGYAIEIKTYGNSTINNVTGTNNKYGVYVNYGNYSTVANSNLYSNNTYGVYYYGSDSGMFINNAVYDNGSYGLYSRNSNYLQADSNMFHSNDQGIYLYQSNYNNIINNISYNNVGAGIMFVTAPDGYLSGNIVYGNVNGIYLSSANRAYLVGNKAYENTDYGFSVDGGLVASVTLNDNQTYSNNHGLRFYRVVDGLINNHASYNNAGRGLWIRSSNSGSINNSQTYNNGGYGIYTQNFYSGAINNVQSYNNGDDGLYLYFADNNIINNFSSYNNQNRGIYTVSNSDNNKYYGSLRVFDNGIANFGGTTASDGRLTGGYSTDSVVASIGREDGYINTVGCMTCDWYSNPKNTFGEFLMNTGTYETCTGRGQDPTGNWTGTDSVQYLYGSLISKQETGVYFDGSIFDVLIGSYDPTQFIAEADSLGVYTGNYACNLCDWDDLWRDNENFITGAFWDNNPGYCDIVAALYGTGGTDQTAYTEIWTGYDNSSCWTTGFDVEYISGGASLPSTLLTNTIYVLTGDYYPTSSDINMSDCSAIISNHDSGSVIYDNSILFDEDSYAILDSLELDQDNSTKLYMVDSSNNTVRNVSLSNVSNAIVVNNSEYSLFDDIKIGEASSQSLNFNSNSHYNVVNKLQVYQNSQTSSYTILLYGSGNTINNALVYGNKYPFLFNSTASDNVLNNVQVLNVDGGSRVIQMSSSPDIKFNNVYIYNNDNASQAIGGFGSASLKYYGNLDIFDNTNDTTNYSSAGSNGDPGVPATWANGSYDTSNDVTWDWIINPLNIDGEYMYDWGLNLTGIRGYISSWSNTTGISYSYGGDNIKTQITPVRYVGADVVNYGLSGNHWDSGKYIGGETARISGYIIALSTVSTTGIDVDIKADVDVNYRLFGDIVTEITGTVSAGVVTTTGVVLSGTFGEKNIFVQFWTGDEGYSHYLDSTSYEFVPFVFFTGSTPNSGDTINYNYFDTQIHIATGGFDNFDYMFSGTNHSSTTYDVYDSGLILMMNFDDVNSIGDVTDDTIVDLSLENNTGSALGGPIFVSSGRWNGAYQLDGINDRIGLSDKTGLQNTSFTISARTKTQGNGVYNIFSTFHYKQSSEYYGYILRLNNDSIQFASLQGGGWSSTNSIISSQVIPEDEFTFVSAVFDGSSVELYKDGVFITGKNIPAPVFYAPEYHADIGAQDIGSSTYGNFLSGMIDELRVRDRALTQDEIQFLYKSNLNKYSTGDWLFTTTNTCLADTGTYVYSGYADAGMVWDEIGRTVYTQIPNLNMTGWVDFDFGIVSVLNTGQTVTGQYANHVQVDDWIGNSGWQTTVQFDSVMSGANYPSNVISGENLFFAYSGLELLSGLDSDDVSVNSSLQSGLNIHTGPIQYIIRSFNSEDFMCNAGSYGDKPRLRLEVPAYQPPDVYSGVLTVDLVY